MLSDVALPFTTGHHPHPFINGTSNHFKKLILPVLGSFYIFYARAIATIDLIKKPQLGDEMNTRALHAHCTCTTRHVCIKEPAPVLPVPNLIMHWSW